MLKKFAFLIITFFAVIPVFGDKKNIKLDPIPKTDPQEKPQRAPALIPVNVIYDNETNIVEVNSFNVLEGEVFLYNSFYELVDYSPCINSVLTLSDDSYHTIVIEGDGWSASGIIE